MNTFLTQPQQVFKQACLDYAAKQIAPKVIQLESQQLPPGAIFKQLGSDGYLGLTLSEKYGGCNLGFLSMALLCEAVAHYEPGLILSLAQHVAVIELLKTFADVDLQAQLLPRLATGEMIGALAFHEEGAGTDIAAIATQAHTEANGKLKLSGTKTGVINAQEAGVVVVAARTTDSIGLYVLGQLDRSLLVARPLRLGLVSGAAYDVVFSNTPATTYGNLSGRGNTVDSSRKYGGPNDISSSNNRSDGLEQIFFALDITKTLVAAAGVGIADAALQAAILHAKSREQFGKNIGRFQAVQWKLADTCIAVDGTRLQLYRAAWSKEESPSEFRKFAAMSKWLSGVAASKAASEALEILGWHGLESGYCVEKLYRDAKALEIVEGTAELQKMILAQQLQI